MHTHRTGKGAAPPGVLADPVGRRTDPVGHLKDCEVAAPDATSRDAGTFLHRPAGHVRSARYGTDGPGLLGPRHRSGAVPGLPLRDLPVRVGCRGSYGLRGRRRQGRCRSPVFRRVP
ncbi:hypothetical protein ABZ172_02375 [Streptomyces sp. NPDC006296]|uniref:hypothetical protein n=1 Tax=Streptomyces sp. NPDC006296 TaxID=3156746 RepID=UPI0033A4F5AC